MIGFGGLRNLREEARRLRESVKAFRRELRKECKSYFDYVIREGEYVRQRKENQRG